MLTSTMVLVLCLPSALAKPSELILGKWEATDATKATIEFFKDGKALLGGKLDAKYKFVDDGIIDMEMKVPGTDRTESKRVKVVIKEDEMTTTDDKGKERKYKRVK